MTGMLAAILIPTFVWRYTLHSEFVPVASQLLFFLALSYAEVCLATLRCNGLILFQFAVSFECNIRYLRSGAW